MEEDKVNKAEEWVDNYNKLMESPNGLGVSGALQSMVLAIEAPYLEVQQQAAPLCTQCGDGDRRPGFPGERQVNSPNQDIDNAPNITQSETSIARSGSNILFGYNDSNRARFGNFSGFAFSSNNGVTWNDCGSMPLNPGWTNGGDPVIAADSRGVFYYSHLGSTNTGQSVIQVNTATVNPGLRTLCMNNSFVAGVGGVTNGFQDKEWMAVGRDSTGGFNAEAIYLTWTEFPPGAGNVAIRFAKWTTGETPTVLIASKNLVTGAALQNSFPVIDSRGNIFVFYEDFNGSYIGVTREIRMVKSTDGGINFSTPITVSEVVRASTDVLTCGVFLRPVIRVTDNKVIRNQEAPHAAIGPDGTLYVVWNDGRNLATTGIDIYLAYSRDGGNTWTVRQVTNSATHQFMPSVIANCSGAHIQYSSFDGVSGVGNGRFALFMKSFSVNRGVSSETRVSTVFSLVPDNRPTNFDDRVATCYMGDYNQIITGPGLSLYHSWGDNRNDPNNGNNPDVFFIQTGNPLWIRTILLCLLAFVLRVLQSVV